MITVPHSFFAPLRARSPLVDGIYHAGNWHLSSDPVWSRDQTATLAVAADTFPDPVPLLIRLAVFDAHPKTPRVLRVNSPGQPSVTCQISSPGPVTILTATPTHRAGAAFSMLDLTLDTLNSPARIGLSVDERLLGLRIASVEPNPTVLSLPLDLTDPDASQSLLAQGWAMVESGVGAWSVSEEARLSLPGYLRSSFAEVVHLEVGLLERRRGDAPLRVRAFCNSRPAASWQFANDRHATLTCPLYGWHDDADCVLTFRFSGLMSPQQLGQSADARPLGFLLRGLNA